jgi:hypothetical protein
MAPHFPTGGIANPDPVTAFANCRWSSDQGHEFFFHIICPQHFPD